MTSTTRRVLHWTSVAAALWMAGCANMTEIPPGTAASAVESSRGKPARIWPERGGGSSWEYPTGPEGRFTYMVRVSPDGRVDRVDKVLDWAFFTTLQPGMSNEEVQHTLGRPIRTTHMPLINQDVMYWRFVETVWKRCFYAYMGPDARLVATGVRDEEVSDHGILTSNPC